MIKKFLLLMMLMIISIPVFAGVSSTALSSLGSDVIKPINWILGILKAIAIIAIVISIILTAIKYISSDAGRKQEVLKNGIVAVVVSAVILLAAYALPNALGLDSSTSVSDSAVILVQDLENNE